ncbi:quercetin dioxygenase-like cupin family protein [Pseudacidovorax sp. 1753]|uniref:cupin domain-containing protein n=1 Tax=Pseudacidovorax sp. 1753 TaxID=3156419 RepID=UPI00339ABF8A
MNQTSTPASSAERKPAGPVRIFRAIDAPELFESGIMAMQPPPPERAPLADTFRRAAELGTHGRVLFRDDRPGGFSLVYAWFKSGYPLPVHSHDSDCLYYVVAGELRFGRETLKAGDGLMVPANAPYAYVAGPQGVEVLEFRQAAQFDFVIRPSSPARWEAAAAICRSQFEHWQTEAPPTRESLGIG